MTPTTQVNASNPAMPAITPTLRGPFRLPLTPAFCALLVIVVPAILAGCGASKDAGNPVPPPAGEATPVAAPVAAMTVRIASLDLSGFRGRIERSHVDELAGLIASNNIDVLAVQGITRYPTVATRTDLVAELASATGMFHAFGETINVSGRQSGNAVFSSYPVSSSDARSYDGVSGNTFEGALRAVIDAGTRPLVVVSTRLPDPLVGNDARACSDLLSAMAAEAGRDPFVVLGNLPRPPGGSAWEEVRGSGETAGGTPGARPGSLWYSHGPLSIGAASGLKCGLGTLLVTEAGIFPQNGR